MSSTHSQTLPIICRGLTPGFDIIDRRGDRYVIKLDPFHLPELSSSAEVISTKMFHALGYNTPENYIVRLDPDSLEVEAGTLLRDELGVKRPPWRMPTFNASACGAAPPG